MNSVWPRRVGPAVTLKQVGDHGIPVVADPLDRSRSFEDRAHVPRDEVELAGLVALGLHLALQERADASSFS